MVLSLPRSALAAGGVCARGTIASPLDLFTITIPHAREAGKRILRRMAAPLSRAAPIE
jgi:hypothetical protein